jgi:hypothetical protein
MVGEGRPSTSLLAHLRDLRDSVVSLSFPLKWQGLKHRIGGGQTRGWSACADHDGEKDEARGQGRNRGAKCDAKWNVRSIRPAISVDLDRRLLFNFMKFHRSKQGA